MITWGNCRYIKWDEDEKWLFIVQLAGHGDLDQSNFPSSDECETLTMTGSRKSETGNLSNNVNHSFKALTAGEQREV